MSTPSHAEIVINAQSQINVVQPTNPAVIPTVPQASEMSVRRMMQVMHIDEQIEALVNAKAQLIELTQRPLSLPEAEAAKLNERQRAMLAKLEAILAEATGALAATTDEASLASEKLTLEQAYVTAAQRHYTQAEVDALILFYDTPTGQSILAKQPQVTQDFLQAALPEQGKSLSETQHKLAQLMPQIRALFNF